MNEWKKICPSCGDEISYKTKYILNVSIKKGLVCKSCSASERKRTPLTVSCSFVCELCKKKIGLKHNVKGKTVCRKCRTKCQFLRTCTWCGKDIKYTTKWRYEKACQNNIKCSKCRQLNIPHTIPYRKPHSEETKDKLRLAFIRNGSIYPSYNKESCLYFEWLNKKNGWNGKYALNGGEYFIKELGYWVDYYEPKYNVVVEWDEKRHYNPDGSLKEKDVIRMKRIKTYLQCEFFRYNERTKELKKYE